MTETELIKAELTLLKDAVNKLFDVEAQLLIAMNRQDESEVRKLQEEIKKRACALRKATKSLDADAGI